MECIEEGAVIQKLGGYMGNVGPGAGNACLQNHLLSGISQAFSGNSNYAPVRLLFE